jgi:hypothetical protein
MDRSLFTIANYKLAKSVSWEITNKYLMTNTDWSPFDKLEEELKLLPNDYIRNRYERCRRFLNECLSLLEENNDSLKELKAHIYRNEFL